MVFGTSKHNIEVGGCGGHVCIYVVVCGWLFFLKNPGRDFLFGVLFRAVDVHVNVMLIITHTHIPIVKAYARGFCDNSTKVDAKRHHQLLKTMQLHSLSKNIGAEYVTTAQRRTLRATINV